MIRIQLSLLVSALCVRLCVAQQAGWRTGQVNTTMCQWDSPRAAVVRDTLYIDGGILWWQPGMSDGSLGSVISDGNPLGLVYLLNFSTPFNTTSNISSIFTTVSKASNGGAVNNIGPQYYDGAMFANDYEWYTYGGLLSYTDGFKLPAGDAVAAYEVYASGPPKNFHPGFRLDTVPTGMTRYVTNGASVSVPSENLGFYFGGLRAQNFGEIIYQPSDDNASMRADIESTNLIQVDLSVQEKEVWGNSSLPSAVPGRANAELVWVPTSAKGILVAIGGVIFPSFAVDVLKNNATSTAQSKAISPTFMRTVAVYDIDKKVWYEQNTTGEAIPTQWTQGCTVLASAPDGSSHNIYWYGGYDGLDLKAGFNDDVWVLSIPSFTWKKVNTGTATNGRAGHRCTKPYPDQMFVVGGYAPAPGAGFQCVNPFIKIFNLTSLSWMTSYNPKIWSNYTVPSVITAVIGGSGTGAATLTKPSPDFADPSMAALFSTKYNASKIVDWYPYNPSPTTPNNRTTLVPTQVPQGSSTPAYLAPVLGVVLGLILISLIILGIVLFRRRKLLKLNGTATQSEAGTMDNRRWVTNWLRSTPVDAKAPTVTTDETPMSPGPYDVEESVSAVPEMENSQPSPRPGPSPILGGSTPRADSPPLGSNSRRPRIGSAISGVSESDRGHLRGISDTSVSTDGGVYATPMERRAVGGHGEGLGIVSPETPSDPARAAALSPLTPPTGVGEGPGGDYLGRGLASNSGGTQKRKSNFSEKLDEVDEK
ncbi:hypothetical protein B0J14DRAFT_620459 [Halenospora varia]|nr:hypothetical protein B0J14DRAFT_620459 [Halenospora varia]